eukprot:SRR837773.10979.p1 GENE.SRR837773.10979~~SRR837773.10979.p1  ORF type:complete len:210 (+),score=14.26 SRR837773.10979:88-630(+)
MILRHCCQGLAEQGADADGGAASVGGRMGPHDVAQLLRSLARAWIPREDYAAQQLLNHVLLDAPAFSVPDMLVALHAAVRLREQVPDVVPDHLHNALLSLLSDQLAAARGAGHLGARELLTAAALLARTGHADLSSWAGLSELFVKLVQSRLADGRSAADTALHSGPGRRGAAMLCRCPQ